MKREKLFLIVQSQLINVEGMIKLKNYLATINHSNDSGKNY